MALLIEDIFKRQDNAAVANLCVDNNCVEVILPHNLTNKFQSLDITVNKPGKCFISKTFSKWFVEQVVNVLNKDKNPADVCVTLKLSEVKLLHAKWIVQMFKHLKTPKGSICNSFESADITKAVEKCNEIRNREKNPFRAL